MTGDSGAKRAQARKRRAGIFLEGLRVAVSNAAAYRANFFMTVTIVLLGNILFPIVTILIYGAGASFPGWTFWEVLLVQAIFTISSGISGMFFNGVFWQTNLSIREGTFEVVLLKPLNPLFWLLVSSIQLENAGTVAGGLVMLALALANTGGVTALGALASIVLFAGGVCVMLGITLVMSATAFKWVGNSRIPEIFDSILNFAKYPQDIFPTAIRGVSSFVLPIAMIAFFPAGALLGRLTPAYLLALIPCAVFLALGVALYRAMIHLYEGVGG